ncbi:MAG: tetratricopeptide repeat protein [Chloroflexales bacterium]|nr:tetratricopeptide repeat protein [Chloroflexales bacterium]
MEQVRTLVAPDQADGGALELSFTQQVNGAFKNYHSILALSRSPLARAALVVPALVRDAVSPTADERGHALRLVLQWAVSLLAPEAERYPLGNDRPYDDPAWRDPRWWRYNILRHRYLEPLHPDEFVEGGRYTETLIALMGIPGPDTFFDERNRAIREVAAWLHQQQQGGVADETLRQMALEQALQQFQHSPAARTLLDIAATFDDVFPRGLLLALAAEERVAGVEAALSSLTTRRFLLADSSGSELWLSPVLRSYLYERQLVGPRQRQHQFVANYYDSAGDALKAAAHWQRGEQWPRAASTLLAAAAELVNELEIGELRDALLQFKADQLPVEQWREVQLLVCDLSAGLGQREAALLACRRALTAANDPRQQARIYRRMGKLYEQHNQRLALEYYQQAAERFNEDTAELVVLLKDRGWLHVLRREWPEAEADLTQAVSLVSEQSLDLQADIFDALAILNRDLKRLARAVVYARNALGLREQLGNLSRVAASHNNLGLLYSASGDYTSAIATFEEALMVYRTIGNQARIGGALVNIGMSHHLAGRRREAIKVYYESLPFLEAVGRRLAQSRAHYNLTEAFAELDEGDAARKHWLLCYQLCRAAGFDDELRDLEQLRERFPAQLAHQPDLQAQAAVADASALALDEERALDIARREGQVTPKTLMVAVHISKATATRRLADLVGRGYLMPQGKGRATAYVLANGAMLGEHAVEPAPDASTRTAPIAQLVREHGERLRGHYRVEALGVVDTARSDAALCLVARFTRAPDMLTFVQLEHWLSELAHCRVDLLPAECFLADQGGQLVAWIAWG